MTALTRADLHPLKAWAFANIATAVLLMSFGKKSCDARAIVTIMLLAAHPAIA